jgi:uncharacterized protein YbjT (DUF2867 family)
MFVMAAIVALTGASGFLGRTFTKHLLASGWQVRALVRRPAPDLEDMGAIPIAGAMEQRDSLERLVEGADAVVHCAGLLKARHKGEFTAVNVEGTARLAEAAAGCPRPPRFLLLSSLAAREPTISPYAASKRGAEETLARCAGPLEHCSLRPPGVYGPGDRATLPLFRPFPCSTSRTWQMSSIVCSPSGTGAAAFWKWTTGGTAATAGPIWPRRPAGT